jgi:DNA-binding MarR family transcriptional regulator
MRSRTRAADADISLHQEAGSAAPMLMYLVKRVELAVRSHLDDLLRPDGLTALQYTALTALEHRPDMSSAQLARNSFVTAQTMADMITTLEGRGLIQRHRDGADRRRLAVVLTPAGQEVLDRYRDAVNALESRMLDGLTKSQVTALRRSLHACHANLATGRPRLSPAAEGPGRRFRGGRVAQASARRPVRGPSTSGWTRRCSSISGAGFRWWCCRWGRRGTCPRSG